MNDARSFRFDAIETLQAWILGRIASALQVSAEQINVDVPFVELGLDSLESVVLVGELEERLGRNLDSSLLWEHSNIRALTRHLAQELSLAPSQIDVVPEGIPCDDSRSRSTPGEPVAIIGLSCRFPGADNASQYWSLLARGVDAIREVPPDRWNLDALYNGDPATRGKMSTRWGGFLDDIGDFDAEFFGLSPREAAQMDPQQRLLIELVWNALENAGQVPAQLRGTATSVYVGVSSDDYSRVQRGSHDLIDAYVGTGNARNMTANRVSYLWDFRGESLAVDTACSSSLVAVDLACRALGRGECRLAIAGGVNVILAPEVTITFSQARMMSADGRCKTFDKRADGYVRSEGCGVVVLKRWSEAIRDGDPIVAVIRGSAVNQDGRSNGLTAPNPEAQRQLLRQALQRAGVSATQVGYVEAHGTGTSLGDPIEVGALAEVYGKGRSAKDPLRIGSVKTNIGHLEAAAGIAGLIKVALMLQHRAIPASLHFEEANPHIPFESIPVEVQRDYCIWPESGRPALAGVSSFGFGGTNAHVILSESDLSPSALPTSAAGPGREQLIPISAASPAALEAMVTAWQHHLEESPAGSLADMAHTAGLRRSHHDYRAAFVARSPAELSGQLKGYLEQPEQAAAAWSDDNRGPVFVFSGQGSLWLGMGRGLLEEAVSGDLLAECDQVIREEAGWSLLAELRADATVSRLADDERAQPALVALQMALAALWRWWGIEPGAVMGHSLGEVAAAQVAGVLSLSDALRVAFHRGRVMQRRAPRGKMAAVTLSAAEAERLLRDLPRVCVAACNGPRLSVLSGEEADLERLRRRLRSQKVAWRYLPVEHAFHSPSMEPCGEELVACLSGLAPGRPTIPLLSTVTGEPVDGATNFGDAGYWGRNVREPVRFRSCVDALWDRGHRIFLEVGPHPILQGGLLQCLADHDRAGSAAGPLSCSLFSLRRDEPARRTLLASLGQLYCLGQPIHWSHVDTDGGRFVSLPTYRFQRQRYWIDREPVESSPGSSFPSPSTEEPAPWWQDKLYEGVWRARSRASGLAEDRGSGGSGPWLIFCDRGGVGEALSAQLESRGVPCTRVFAGEAYHASSGTYWLDPGRPADFERLCSRLSGEPPWRGVVHLWSLDLAAAGQLESSALQREVSHNCGTVLRLLQSLGGSGEPATDGMPVQHAARPRLWLVTREAQPVGAEPAAISLSQSPLWGLGRVIYLEHPEMWGGLFDLPSDVPADEDALRALVDELLLPEGEDLVAFRAGQRYVCRLARCEHTLSNSLQGLSPASVWRGDGVYLITGGLGELGLALARYLVDQGVRELVLTSRRGLSREGPAGARVAAAVQALEDRGARVEVVASDVGDPVQMRALLARVADRPLRGLLHAAGVGQLASLRETNTSQLADVLQAKVAGGWLLHELTREMDLDVFVLFSSAVSTWGSPRQGGYAAANAYLDGLAHYRRSLGLPALSVNWGPWSGEGMASGDTQQLLSRMGVRSLPVERAVDLLSRLVGTTITQVTAADVDWEVLRPLYEAKADRSLLQEIAIHVHTGQPPEKPALAQQLEKVEPTARRKLMSTHLRHQVSSVLGWQAARIDSRRGFFEMGMDSLMAVELSRSLQRDITPTLSPAAIFSHPNIDALGQHILRDLLQLEPQKAASLAIPAAAMDPIALIGFDCRFPGQSNSPGAFWRLLAQGVDAITEVPRQRWNVSELFSADPDERGKMYTRWGGFLENVDQFDADFFRITPREAVTMDPQQRLLLEVSWRALERAGICRETLAGSRTGVFVGISGNDYLQLKIKHDEFAQIDRYHGTGNALSVAAARISHFLGLQGPCLSVDTACSSSLVAVHLACQALRAGEADVALAAGVNLILSPETTICLSRARMMSADGRCKTFDKRADGYVRSEGCGVVVLKRWSEAIRDGDPIVAVIRGSAVNQDGASSSLTVPNGAAQVQVISNAVAAANIDSTQVGYVEAHGTGTSLGDPIEVGALAEVYGKGRSAKDPLRIGSVKTNIGHLEAAAGIAGLIKVALMLQHRAIPASLHFEEANPHIPFESIPVEVQRDYCIWPESGRPALAGVSSFGFGGTNAHVILSESDLSPSALPTSAAGPGREQLIPISAASPAALEAMVTAWQHHLEESPAGSLADMAHTAGLRRSHHDYRAAFVARSPAELSGQLKGYLEQPEQAAAAWSDDNRGPVFVFSGQGSLWLGMGRGLLEEAVSGDLLAECDQVIREEAGWSLLAELRADATVSRLADDERAQPALVALQMALAALWRWWGIEPGAVMGHSLGEVAAAQVAGVLSLSDALRVAFHRGRVMQRRAPRGKMAAVTLSAAEAERLLRDLPRVCVAACNGPRLSVLSGEEADLERLRRRLRSQKVAWRYLPVEHAFHSPSMEPCGEELVACLSGLAPGRPTIPLLSTVTGEPVDGATNFGDAGYWGRNVREPVRFRSCVDALWDRGHRIFLEVGPHPILQGGLLQCLADHDRAGSAAGPLSCSLFSLRRDEPARRTLLASLGQLYCLGQPIHWSHVDTDGGRFVSLPTYRFQRQRYWIDREPVESSPGSSFPSPSVPWWQDKLYEGVWRARSRASGLAEDRGSGGSGPWLIFCDRGGVGEALSAQLESRGVPCTRVFAGEAYHASSGTYWLDPGRPADFERLCSRLSGEPPWRGVVHLWSLDLAAAGQLESSALQREVSHNCGTVLRLLQSLGGSGEPATDGMPVQHAARPRLWLVTREAQPVGAEPAAISLSQSPLWGLGRVIYLEHPEMWGGLFDLPSDVPADEDALRALVDELLLPEGEDLVAFRAGQRYVCRLARCEHTLSNSLQGLSPASVWRGDGVYLITGGLGELGLALARYLVDQGVRELVLTSRRGLSREGPAGARVAAAVQALEDRGARVEVVASDVGDPVQMRALLARVADRPLRGLLHAAGVGQLASLRETNTSQLADVLQAKVAGGWLLHELTREMDLDVFVLFSSAAATWGSAKLGGYAAANAYLDGLAHYRRSLGLPALSVNWGPWSGEGMASGDTQQLLSRMGVRSLPVERAVDLLSRLVGTTITQVTAADVDWGIFRPLYEAKAHRSLFRELTIDRCTIHPPAKAASIEHLEQASFAARREWMISFLCQQLSSLMGRDAEQVDARRGFFEMGMDSLMAVELSQRLQASLTPAFTAPAVFDHPNVESLSDHILRDLLQLEPTTAAAAPANSQDDKLLEEIEQLSETEAENRLQERLAFLMGD